MIATSFLLSLLFAASTVDALELKDDIFYYYNDSQEDGFLAVSRVPTLRPSALRPASTKPTSIASVKPSWRPTVAPSFRSTALPSTLSTALPSTPKSNAPTLPPTTNQNLYTIINYGNVTLTYVNSVSASPTEAPLSGSGASRSKIPPPTRAPNVPTTTPNYRLSGSAAPSTPTQSKANTKSPPPTIFQGSINTADGVFYHAGKTILTGQVNLYNIYLGYDFAKDTTANQTRLLVDHFAANIGGSPWGNILKSYYQDVNNVKTFASNKMTFAKSVPVSTRATSFTYKELADLILKLFYTGKLPYDPNGIYNILFHGSINISVPSSNNRKSYWLNDWCAFHLSLTIRSSSGARSLLHFSAIGDPSAAPPAAPGATAVADAAGCMALPRGVATANGNVGADNMASKYAHEMAEVITNFNGAWHNSKGLEAADICQELYGTNKNSNMNLGEKPFLIQGLWNFAEKVCAISA